MSTSTTAQEDWRASVEQSYRNREVREIAKILASLEKDGKSKLPLAIKFEDLIWKSATSLADYRKRLAKRLKKLQKSYTPAEQKPEQEIQAKFLKIRQEYGDRLRFIVKYAPEALKIMKRKSGSGSSKSLQAHTDNAKQWAIELKVLDKTVPTYSGTLEHLNKMEALLAQRVDNIRSHVVKLAQPDLFLKETIEKLEKELLEGEKGDATNKLMADATNKVIRKHGLQPLENPLALLLESYEKVQAPVPPLASTEEKETKAHALLHLEKVRAASQVFAAYMALDSKKGENGQVLIPPQSLSKSHKVAVDATKRVAEITQQITPVKKTEVKLEDAWTKVLELPSNTILDVDEPPAKRPKRELSEAISSRVLLTPGRKATSNLLTELKRKKAQLNKDQSLVLEFGTAFKMTIHMVPLLVKTEELKQEETLEIWGTQGSRQVLGHVVQQKLRYASTQATHVLRQCFADTAGSDRSDFEVEISEATALLKFIGLVRSTYMPEWQDAEL